MVKAPERLAARDVVRGPGSVPIQLRVNGAVYNLQVEPRRTLLDALRIDLHLTGTKKVCDMGECGACTVLIDGRTAYSCLVLAIECEGMDILTIEGLSDGASLDPIQEAFVQHDAYQCGYCTSGQVMAVRGLVERNPNPSAEDIRVGVSGNICRCGAYRQILEAAADGSRAYTVGRTGAGSEKAGRASRRSRVSRPA